MGRWGTAVLIRCDTAPDGGLTAPVCGRLAGSATGMAVASGTASLGRPNQPAAAMSLSEAIACSALAGRWMGSALIIHITQSQMGWGTSGATVFSGYTMCWRCASITPFTVESS